MSTLFGNPIADGTHLAHRTVKGADTSWPLPLCWHAGIAARSGEREANDDEAWWLSVDHGALDPDTISATTDPDGVTCRDCREWMHS